MGKYSTGQNGKGSKPRPLSNRAKFLKNWDDIFSNKKIDKKTEKSDTQEIYEKSTDSTRTEK